MFNNPGAVRATLIKMEGQQAMVHPRTPLKPEPILKLGEMLTRSLVRDSPLQSIERLQICETNGTFTTEVPELSPKST